ncbi:hatching enzyme 1.2 [Nelusetta ayraudi]|uniref:hatching enzyme 1.2 n=1 Tax=Nelusetta ayraudi TaxID=303726 RepID=UPI003F6FA983
MCHKSFFTVLLFAQFINAVVPSPIPNATQVLQQNASKTFMYTNNPETLDEMLKKDQAIVEGDMILVESRIAVRRSWSTKEIPYVISAELESRTDEILLATAMLSERTCVSFHPRTTERDYLLFKHSHGCSSFLGCIGGEQPLFLGPHCGVGNIVHEILHALGFHHEHTRKDRDQYVRLLPHNIKEGKAKNFNILEGEIYNLSYDLSSIMHYGSHFFSQNGLPTLVPLDENKSTGQRVMMTEMDIERVRRHYNCDAVDEKTGDESDKLKNNVNNKKEETTTSAPTPLHHVDAATRGQPGTGGATNRL